MWQLGPGVYDDGQGGLHLDVAEMLRGHGYADTPANRDTLIDAAIRLFQAMPRPTHQVRDNA